MISPFVTRSHHREVAHICRGFARYEQGDKLLPSEERSTQAHSPVGPSLLLTHINGCLPIVSRVERNLQMRSARLWRCRITVAICAGLHTCWLAVRIAATTARSPATGDRTARGRGAVDSRTAWVLATGSEATALP